jgi:hypothetical protein
MPDYPANGYLSLDMLIALIRQPEQGQIAKLVERYRNLFEEKPGSSHNHQAWKGGYSDHITEVGNIAHLLFGILNEIRPLPFTLGDAMLCLFLHDIEKPFKEEPEWDPPADMYLQPLYKDMREKDVRKVHILGKLGFKFEDEDGKRLANAIFFAEGEILEYSNKHRCMNELAAFVHMCDIASARLWHDRPLAEGDSWGKRIRSGVAACYGCTEGILVEDLVQGERGPMHRACQEAAYRPADPRTEPEVWPNTPLVTFKLEKGMFKRD